MKKSSLKMKNLKEKLKTLNDNKIELLVNLISVQEEYNDLASPISSPEEWLYGLSIANLKDLDKVDKSKSNRLADWKRRSKLRKISQNSLSELESLNAKIKFTKLDLLSANVEHVLNNGFKNEI